MLLAIDTATQMISLAVHDGQRLLAENTWHSPNNHTAELAPAVNALLQDCNVPANTLTALAVSIGPGSYTGLRIGVALAKGMALARGLPLVGISALDILAAGQPQASGALVAIVPAGRGRIVAGRYQWRKSRWVNRGEPELMDWETLFASIDGPANLTGEIDSDGLEAVAQAKAKAVPITLIPAAYRLRRAGFLADEALARLSENPNGHQAAKLVPIYVKTKDIPS